MKIRKDKPIGKLISSITQPNGDVLETYEVVILGIRCHYLHFAEFEENTEMLEPFTGHTITLN